MSNTLWRHLQLFTSYVTGRHVSVSVGDAVSTPASFHGGVPQGSVLGPLLLSYTLGDLIRNYNIQFQFYANYKNLSPS